MYAHDHHDNDYDDDNDYVYKYQLILLQSASNKADSIHNNMVGNRVRILVNTHIELLAQIEPQ